MSFDKPFKVNGYEYTNVATALADKWLMSQAFWDSHPAALLKEHSGDIKAAINALEEELVAEFHETAAKLNYHNNRLEDWMTDMLQYIAEGIDYNQLATGMIDGCL